MPGREIIITSLDHGLLTAILNSPIAQQGPDRDHLSELRAELDRATIVEPGEVPADVITMNSRFRVRDAASGEVHEYTLVYPNLADITKGLISILAPIGTALLGYRAGDTVEWKVPSGTRVLKVESVLYQPESAGKDL
ncbi:MAG TPA: nucleoside diphosphate kinase regulator [Candidatus Aminicenantes bacterium]|nr:nucleoside diphosphate kinase regulator [Candidatus Aminicenantes bacterium]HRY65590.1 nucleoside diphosphate kinase regulator [Candidatus Aminicenantes bacterium]HRZ72522.1 nucleoside diphosphate kinase regulator [Candidatus Aminicenantes bacterium]